MRSIFLALSVMTGIAGCASVEHKPDQDSRDSSGIPWQLETEASYPHSVGEEAGLFESAVRASTADERFGYSASYSVESGELVRSLAADDSPSREVPKDVARQTISQEFRLALPAYLGSPVEVSVDSLRETRLALDGEQRQEQTRAQLQWQPEPVSLELEWTPPSDLSSLGGPVECPMQGQLRVPASLSPMNTESSVDVSQQHCLVHAPERGLEDMRLQTQGFAWRWGDGLDNTVRMHRLVPEATAYGVPAVRPGYEMGIRHRHTFAGWQMEADVARRQLREQPHENESGHDSHWTVDLLLRRDLDLFILTARWMQSKDPLWFAPAATPVGNERLSVLLDFGNWLTRVLPRLDAGMSASWEHSENDEGRDDNQIKWNFSLFW